MTAIRSVAGIKSRNSTPLREARLLFLHLSDIHFRWPKLGRKYDLDDDLRNELQRDAAIMVEQLGTPTATLVTGDIAFSASAEEYDIASKWLRDDLRHVTGCEGENVCCIPGNHDVDWNVVRKSRPIRDCHATLRKEQQHLLDGTIQDYSSDPYVFYGALKNYNSFAGQFGCDVSVADPFWTRDFGLNDGSVLRIRGVNSALISDEKDDIRTGQLLVLGNHQCTMKNEYGVEHMFLCHHPPSWLLDQDEVEKRLSRARIQMFGHKHDQKLTEIDRRLRIAAGAVHPDRRERNWLPRYNWVEVSVAGEADQRVLDVRVHPRVWEDTQQKFLADFAACGGNSSRTYSLPIDSWTPATPSEASSRLPVAGFATPAAAIQVPPPVTAAEHQIVDPARTLAHRFLSLPFLKRLEVAQALRLLRDEDAGLPEPERSKQIFSRAKESRQLEELWREVERQHGDGKHPVNPFAKMS